jgi:hypothetical protein
MGTPITYVIDCDTAQRISRPRPRTRRHSWSPSPGLHAVTFSALIIVSSVALGTTLQSVPAPAARLVTTHATDAVSRSVEKPWDSRSSLTVTDGLTAQQSSDDPTTEPVTNVTATTYVMVPARETGSGHGSGDTSTATAVEAAPQHPDPQGESPRTPVTQHLLDDHSHPLVPKDVLPVGLPSDVADVELSRRP